MRWKVEIKPTAEKQYSRLEKKTRARIKQALKSLEAMENPFLHKDVRPLTGLLRGDYRLRVGKWRILFTPDSKRRVLQVYAILPRGNAY